MAQVIVVEDNQTMLDLLTLNLKTFASADVIPRENAAEVIDLLSLLPSVDLIIAKNYIKNQNVPHAIVDFLIDNRLDIPVIIVGDVQEDYPGIEEIATTVSDTKDWEEIVKTACKSLGVSEESLTKKMSPDFVPVPTRYFLSLESTFCDVYIRIKKGPGDYQFVKRIHQGEKYPMDVVNKYINQGLKHFYIAKEYEENFTNFVSNQLVEKLNDKSIKLDEKIDIMAEGYSIALQEIYKMGFTSATVQLAESIVHSMIDTFKVNPEMSPLLFKIINSKTGYLYRHAHMCSIVSSEILKNMGRDKKELHETMAYAAFFKDIAFVENEELAKISTFNALEESELDEFSWDLVFNHAQEAANIVRKLEDAPLDVDTIIKNHHGTTNGRGFATENNKTDFPKLSLIFIVAVEFTNELLAFKELGRKPRPIVDILKEKYDVSKMKDIIHALEKTIKNS
ncbi:hypothetical protein M899_1770 [Bacteriovorax sp. BSW11_IV]|uniref:hypothetical protein n=1 Tax=Bacteriovorax sp. BSW11_IV TaxID=1353529 RepID=UPI00038A06D2|nr:hypothetical protein [Bacteriovorax sp. BSW11_IV]EQC49439.1 hypothetical protein M899_1770 [Bacteriovorax sp. BSW11_IV]